MSVPARPATPSVLRRRTGGLLVLLALVVALAAPAASAQTPVVDDVLAAVTCSGLLDDVPVALGEVTGGLVDPAYCHTSSSTVACSPPGSTCTAESSTTVEGSEIDVTATGVADPSGYMSLSVGTSDATTGCGVPAYVPATIRFDSNGVSDIVVTHRVPKALDHQTPENGAGNREVCYASPIPFQDQTGATVNQGLLPDCDPEAPVAPCVALRAKDSADLVLAIRVPSNDPVWKLV